MPRLICLLLAALLTGCAASSTPHYDARFGDAVREARSRMILNPNAGAGSDPVAGMDGLAARESFERYHESFKAPPPVVNVINIGGAVSGRGGQ
jgi:uncharacterized protein YceK